MCTNNPTCESNETEISNDELICSECGLVLENESIEQPWQQGAPMTDFHSSRPLKSRSLGGAPFDTRHPDARRSRTNIAIARADRRNRPRPRSKFEQELFDIIDNIDENPTVRRILMNLISDTIGLVGPAKLGATRRSMKENLTEKKRVLNKRRAYIIVAMRVANEAGIPIHTESYEEEWGISDHYLQQIEISSVGTEGKTPLRLKTAMQRASGLSNQIRLNGVVDYNEQRRQQLNQEIVRIRGLLENELGIAHAISLIQQTIELISNLGEPIIDPQSENLGDSANLSAKQLVREALLASARALSYSTTDIRAIRLCLGIRSKRPSSRFTGDLAAAAVEEE